VDEGDRPPPKTERDEIRCEPGATDEHDTRL